MKIFYTDHYVLPLPPGHRFPMQKYSLLRQRAVDAGLAGGEALREPHAVTDEELLRAHDAGYLRLVFELCRAAGVPVAVSMAGGYARNIADTVDIHFATVATAARFSRAALPTLRAVCAIEIKNRVFCFSKVKIS